MKSLEAERRKRAGERASWPLRTFSLGAEPGDDLSDQTTPEERLAMMWGLARRAWLLSGRPLPDYERRSAPGRVVRTGR
jgi:hypothetical protein